jgi:hypothetical protein
MYTSSSVDALDASYIYTSYKLHYSNPVFPTLLREMQGWKTLVKYMN